MDKKREKGLERQDGTLFKDEVNTPASLRPKLDPDLGLPEVQGLESGPNCTSRAFSRVRT